MPRKIVLFLIISICFVLQTTTLKALSFANITPNLLLIVVASFGLMRGKKEGMCIGFFSGLIIDIFCGFYLGIYALLYMYIGYLTGFFQKRFYPEDIKFPLLIISSSDLNLNLIIYLILFLTRSRYDFGYYFTNIILPELVYTTIVTIFFYLLLLKINQKLEAYEKRRAIKFDL
ncbi:MAG: rod shape-determining protein MreD [Agathobacter sp.]|nr:rod shape-determining protein MreD [Agathobacter sp.]